MEKNNIKKILFLIVKLLIALFIISFLLYWFGYHELIKIERYSSVDYQLHYNKSLYREIGKNQARILWSLTPFGEYQYEILQTRLLNSNKYILDSFPVYVNQDPFVRVKLLQEMASCSFEARQNVKISIAFMEQNKKYLESIQKTVSVDHWEDAYERCCNVLASNYKRNKQYELAAQLLLQSQKKVKLRYINYLSDSSNWESMLSFAAELYENQLANPKKALECYQILTIPLDQIPKERISNTLSLNELKSISNSLESYKSKVKELSKQLGITVNYGGKK